MLITEQLVFIAVFFLCFGFFIYIHVAYPFWSHMPVMHTPYSWAQTLFNQSGESIEKLPYRNKFVKTLEFNTANTNIIDSFELKTKFTDILHCCYLPSDSILCTMDTAKFDAIFSGHEASYVTIGQNGCVASLPLQSGSDKKHLYSISYLASPHKDITRKLLSTHIFNCRRKSPTNPHFLYKSYEQCSGAVPYMSFKTHLYFIGKQTSTSAIPVQHIGKNNWAFIYPIIDTINAKYAFTTWLTPVALNARSNAGLLWVFAILEPLTGVVISAYFLEDALTLYENLEYGKLALNLAGSYKDARMSDRDFYAGLLKCIQIVQKQNLDYVMLTVDDVGHNAYLLQQNPMKITSGNYYLINQYFSKGVDKESAFIYGF